MTNRLRIVASPDGEAESLVIHQDARIFLSKLQPQQTATHHIAADRHAWLQVLRGAVAAGGHELSAGDGAAVSNETELEIVGTSDAEIMLFDLA